MDFEQAQVKTGFRLPFQYLPNNNNTALKLHVPLGFFFSPFNCESNQYQTTAPRCTKCGSVAHPYANKNKSARRWTCSFCATDNALMMDVGNYNAEEYVEGKSGQNGLFLVLDMTMASQEFEGLKSTILKTIDLLPRNIYVGLIAFGRSVYVYDFSEASLKFHCFNGHKEYTPATILQQLGIQAKTDPRKVGCANYYALVENNIHKLKQAIECLEADSFPYDQMKERQQRATGCALNILLSMLDTCNINTRIALAINGPCTIGPGKIVDLPLIETLRTWKDITEDTMNNKNFKAAKKFYDGIEARLTMKHTLDLWAFGLDQYGLVEMKDMVTKSGGILAMHQLFNHFIFDNSFTMHYQANEQGLFNFPIAAKLNIYISKDIKVKGLLGYGKSLKDDKLAQASEMETGEGKTSAWYIGGIPANSALAFILANAQASKQDLKSQVT